MAKYQHEGDNDKGQSKQARQSVANRRRELAIRAKDNAAAKVRRDRGKPKAGG